MKIDINLSGDELRPLLDYCFDLAGEKISRLNLSWKPEQGSPVFTVNGTYTTRGWTEWTQGFMYGCQILVFDGTGDQTLLEMGRSNTLKYMTPHVSHVGIHDHGFNNISTYGNLRRLALEGKAKVSQDAIDFYELALKVSGAVQASRWSTINDGTGFIPSFNGPHSLFSDAIRSCRSLMVAHSLGHRLMGEGDKSISLLGRAVEHIINTSRYNVYYGEGRDIYDVKGRVVHESIFNMNDGSYRCPNSQQGYSPFTTWTRGLAWVLLGAAEELEFIQTLPEDELSQWGGRLKIKKLLEKMARATSDFYIENSTTDGIVYWDTGAPGLANMPDWKNEKAQIDNPYEPVDASASAIAAQGLLRLGRVLDTNTTTGRQYWQAGLTVARTLLQPPYLSRDLNHQGILLHSVYHRPNGWDYVPEGHVVPQGESSMWGDYHLMELAVYLKRIVEGEEYYTFFGPKRQSVI